MAQSMVIEEKGTTRCRSGAWPGGPVFLCHICALGSTYFAIRVLVETAPPGYLQRALRDSGASPVRVVALPACACAGTGRVGKHGMARCVHVPGRLRRALLGREDNSLRRRVRAGATIPVWTALFEIFVFKKEKIRLPLILAICLGLVGVATLASVSGAGQSKLLACLAILGSEISWSFGTVLSKSMRLPSSKLMSAGGQMMIGGLMLLVASASVGELHPFPHLSPRAIFSLLYLIVAGSLVAFTAYMWLLGRMPATKVASYAYVNPVIALAIGWALGGEPLTARTIFGTGLVLASVMLLLGNFGKKTTVQK